MKTPHEVDEMRKAAYAAMLKAKDEKLLGCGNDTDEVYAEGVEAGLLWVLGDAGSPFPR